MFVSDGIRRPASSSEALTRIRRLTPARTAHWGLGTEPACAWPAHIALRRDGAPTGDNWSTSASPSLVFPSPDVPPGQLCTWSQSAISRLILLMRFIRSLRVCTAWPGCRTACAKGARKGQRVSPLRFVQHPKRAGLKIFRKMEWKLLSYQHGRVLCPRRLVHGLATVALTK